METNPGRPRPASSEKPGLMRFVADEDRSLWLVLQKMALVFSGCLLLELLSVWLRSQLPAATLPLLPVAGFAFAALLVFSESAIIPILVAVTAVGLVFPQEENPLLRIFSLSLGVILGWVLSRKLFSRKRLEAPLLRPNETLFFFIGGGTFAAALAASLLLAGLVLVGAPPAIPAALLWLRIFLGTLAGFVALTPASYYLLRGDFSTPVKDHRPGETVLLFAALLLAVVVAVSTPIPHHLQAVSLTTIPFPFLIWIALRRGLRATSLALALMALATLIFPYLWNTPSEDSRIFFDGFYQVQFIFLSVSCLLLASQRDAISALALKTRLAHEAAEFCAWEWSLQGGITFWSVAWTARTGLPAETRMPLERWIETVHPDDQQEFADTISRGAHNPIPGFTMRFRSWDVNKRDWYWAKSIGHLIKLDAGGNPLKAIGLVLDIDDVVEAEKLRSSSLQNQAELAALRAQLNPHFLFNCLNSIRALIGRDEHKAREMVTTLAALLRNLLEQRNESFETIAAELGIIQKYLNLEHIRFGSRLQTEISVDPAAMDCHVPCFLILTLVENAVKHGISRFPDGGLLKVDVLLRKNALVISVMNPGHLQESGKGVGLENTRRRVQLMTDHGDAFEIFENPPGRVVARVELPVRTVGPRSGLGPTAPSNAETPPYENGSFHKNSPRSSPPPVAPRPPTSLPPPSEG